MRGMLATWSALTFSIENSSPFWTESEKAVVPPAPLALAVGGPVVTRLSEETEKSAQGLSFFFHASRLLRFAFCAGHGTANSTTFVLSSDADGVLPHP